jgi:hypothetical protein
MQASIPPTPLKKEGCLFRSPQPTPVDATWGDPKTALAHRTGSPEKANLVGVFENWGKNRYFTAVFD